MANKRLDYDKIYEIVMQCRKSGLSDRQWCLDNGIVPSIFYYWVRKLRQRACYELPETECHSSDVSVVAKKQNVGCVNIQPDPVQKNTGIQSSNGLESSNIVLQYGDVRIVLSDYFDEQALKRVLLTLRETVC